MASAAWWLLLRLFALELVLLLALLDVRLPLLWW